MNLPQIIEVEIGMKFEFEHFLGLPGFSHNELTTKRITVRMTRTILIPITTFIWVPVSEQNKYFFPPRALSLVEGRAYELLSWNMLKKLINSEWFLIDFPFLLMLGISHYRWKSCKKCFTISCYCQANEHGYEELSGFFVALINSITNWFLNEESGTSGTLASSAKQIQKHWYSPFFIE